MVWTCSLYMQSSVAIHCHTVVGDGILLEFLSVRVFATLTRESEHQIEVCSTQEVYCLRLSANFDAVFNIFRGGNGLFNRIQIAETSL